MYNVKATGQYTGRGERQRLFIVKPIHKEGRGGGETDTCVKFTSQYITGMGGGGGGGARDRDCLLLSQYTRREGVGERLTHVSSSPANT